MLKYRPNDPKIKNRALREEQIVNRKAKPAKGGKGAKPKPHRQGRAKH
jgi:hypothetical protein